MAGVIPAEAGIHTRKERIMKGLVCTEIGKIELKDVPKPEIKDDGEILIKVTKCTICGSDVHLMHGGIASEPPYVLGHEYVGVVEEVGKAVRKFKPGDRVAGPPATFCGRCENCQAGAIAQCENGGIYGSGPTAGDLSGAQSEYMVLPYADSNTLHIPDNISDETALLICDNVGTGYFAVANGDPTPGDTIVVFGVGPVGLCAVQCAKKLFGPSQVIAVDYIDSRLEKAREMGADHTVNASEDVVAKVMELTGGRGADVCSECAGDQKAFADAVRCAAVQGTVSVVGIGEKMDIPLPDAFVKNLSIKSGLGLIPNLRQLFDLVSRGVIDPSPTITHRISLDQIVEYYPKAEKYEDGIIKIAVTP
jgi:threonine dehydrogenase-like Zn-dependent dehydrogenase